MFLTAVCKTVALIVRRAASGSIPPFPTNLIFERMVILNET